VARSLWVRSRHGLLLAVSTFVWFLAAGATSVAEGPPAVTIDPASEVSYTSATLSGTVNPEGGPAQTYFGFELSTEPDNPESWFQVTFTSFNNEGTSPVPVEEPISGLQTGTQYYARLWAEHEGGADRVATEPPYPSFTTLATTPPDVTIDPPGSVTGTTAAVSGTVNPVAPAGSSSAYDVNWRFECIPSCNSDGGTVAADSSPHAVAETLTGLEPNTAYEVSLVGSNVGASDSDGPILLTTEPVAPAVQTLFAGPVDEDSAKLAGRVNPHNSTTTYSFQWGTDTGYGNTVAAMPETLPVDNSYHFVSAELPGLQAGRTYHFRLVATNSESGEETQGEDRTFMTLAPPSQPICANAEAQIELSALLPSCRAYEQVTPTDKDYGVNSGEPFLAFAAEGGGAAAFTTNGPLPGSEAGASQNLYFTERGPQGWKYTPLTPPQVPTPGGTTYPSVQGFSPDLRRMFIKTANPPLLPEAAPDIANLYMRENGPERYRLISVPQTFGPIRPFITYGGASEDFSRVVFASEEPLLPEAEGIGRNIYEWNNGSLDLFRLPGGEVAGQAEFAGGAISRGFNAINADASRIVFRSDQDLYVRLNHSEATKVSASERAETDTNGGPAEFWAATKGVGTVFFTSTRALTEDANTGRDAQGNLTGASANLYAYDVDSGDLHDLTVDDSRNGPEVLGVVGTSDDGSYVYYVARGKLAGAAAAGAPNLYLLHDGETRFIATLDEADGNNWIRQLRFLSSRVTPDGRHALLSSSARLTGYDNTSSETGSPVTELYLYSADDNSMACVSCRADGSAPVGGAAVSAQPLPLNITRYPNRFLTADGGTVVFDTADSLVPRDSNGKRDVYEYREGRARLVTTGASEYDAQFADMSADGTDLLFATKEQLLKSDQDGYSDLYDARRDGGYIPPLPPVPPCSGGECVRNASTPPPAPNLGSNLFHGAGNVKQNRKRCGKGMRKVRRHGRARCVKKKHTKAGKKRTGANKGGAK
jgi:hypothetical protein